MYRRRRFGAVAGIVLAVGAGAALAGAGPAAADPTIIPGTYTITVEGGDGNLHLKPVTIGPACSNGSDDDLDGIVDYPADTGCADANDANEATANTPYVKPTYVVNIDAAGNITAPAANITWQPAYTKQDGGPLGLLDTVTRFVSDNVPSVGGNSLTGTLDPVTGQLDLRWRWHVTTGAGTLGVTIWIGTTGNPLDTNLSSTKPTGAAFDPDTLTARVIDDTMTLPASVCTGNALTCITAKAQADAQLGLPATAGQSAFRVNFRFDRSPIDAGTVEPPDLAIAKSHVGNFQVGSQGSYTLAVSNVGTGPTTGPVTVTDAVPAGLSLVSMSGSGWSCVAASCTHAGPVAAGASLPDITVTVDATAAGSVTNVASVSTAGDTNAGNDTASDPTTVDPAPVLPPDLAIAKSHVGNFQVGSQGSYTLAVSNVGTGPTTGPVTVTDAVPAGLSLVSMSGSGWSCVAASCTHAGPVAAGASLADITVTVDATAAGSVTNVASVSTAGDTNAGNDTASDPTTVIDPNADDDTLILAVRGAWTYNNTAELLTGNIEVFKNANGSVRAVSGSGTIPGANGGTANVAINASQVWVLPVYTGNVAVVDPGASISLNAPIFFRPVYTASGTNAAKGSASWFTSSFPWRSYTVTWTVDDIS